MDKEINKICLLSVGSNTWIAGYIYIDHILNAIRQYSPLTEIIIILHPRADKAQYKSEFYEKIPIYQYTTYRGLSIYKKVLAPLYALFRGHRWLSLESILAYLDPDFIYPLPYAINIPKSAHWIPDFQHRVLPEFFPGKEYIQRENAIQKILKNSNHVILSSQNALNHFRLYYPKAHQLVSVLPFYAYFDPSFFQADPKDTLINFGLPSKYFIFSSNFWKHKNHLTLFKALVIAREKFPDIQLVLTGSLDDYRFPAYKKELLDSIQNKGLQNNIHILGLIPRFDQVQLMRQSIAIIQPSLFEGWSALVEDARALGKKIILSDIEIHREQDPDHAIYFDPNDESALAEILTTYWESANSGTDHMKEARAREKSIPLLKSFADNFMNIIHKSQAC